MIIALVIIAKLNFDHTRGMLVDSGKQKSELISDEIHHIFKFKELALEDLEIELETEMQRLSNRLVSYYFESTAGIDSVNLDSIRNVLGVDTSQVDLYVIDTNGVVISTTMKSDLNLNLYSFGPEFSQFLKERFNDKRFFCSRFGEEIKTGKLKKYSYEKTRNGNFLIEIGHYSTRADEIIQTFNSRLDSISEKQPSILDVELFVDDHNPLTLDKSKSLPEIHKSVLYQTFEDKTNHTLVEIEDGLKIHYEYIYSQDEDDPKEFGSVVRIKSNKSVEEELLRDAFIKTLFIFGGTIGVLILLLFLNARSISRPLKELVVKMNNIMEGDLSQRATVTGNNEVTTLTEQFNLMLDKLESSYKQLDNQKTEIKEQRDQIKEKSEGVTDSIRYAKKIQAALFPSADHVNKIFPEHLLYYKPKSIVSGDFYWMEEANGYKYFAVVDCTGHGVPGAFVSLVGLNALNRTIREFQMSDPGSILNKVNELVEQSLQQKDADIKDGMDIALCCYSEKDNKLYFSGANSPIFITRKSGNGNLIIDKSWSEAHESNQDYFFYEIKGNRRPIGRAELKDEDFRTVEIELKPGDTIYLYTDGITDQFGGPDGRKFKLRNLRKLVLDIQYLPLEEQKEKVRQTMEDWIGGEKNEQIDDMCLIAIRV